jgi:hypothetical protein
MGQERKLRKASRDNPGYLERLCLSQTVPCREISFDPHSSVCPYGTGSFGVLVLIAAQACPDGTKSSRKKNPVCLPSLEGQACSFGNGVIVSHLASMHAWPTRKIGCAVRVDTHELINEDGTAPPCR